MDMQSLLSLRLSQLPGYGKWFVGMFTLMMLCVVMWAMWMLAIEYGKFEPDRQPAVEIVPDSVQVYDDDISADIASDSEVVLAPEWDSIHAGEELPIDSAEIKQMAQAEKNSREDENESDPERAYRRLRHNVSLAHTHINGQTLLFFAIGLIFLFTSVAARTKTIAFIVFGLSVIVHNVGLSGKGFASIFDDMLAISGVLILAAIVYMALMIFAELLRAPKHE